MKENLLITFGCSWTYGVGAAYESGMLHPEYAKIARDEDKCNELSFRGILSSKFMADNINFAQVGSSNARQFRLAKDFFMSDEFKICQRRYNKIIVLWAITATSRFELFHVPRNEYINFNYEPGKVNVFPFHKEFTMLVYDHDTAVHTLLAEMHFFNCFFKSNNIHNVWVDTFNHHNYQPNRLPNLLFDDEKPRDLLSKLCVKYNMQGPDSRYHASTWRQDSNKLPFLVDHGILNPYSFHPTIQGHIDIANFIEPKIAKLL